MWRHDEAEQHSHVIKQGNNGKVQIKPRFCDLTLMLTIWKRSTRPHPGNQSPKPGDVYMHTQVTMRFSDHPRCVKLWAWEFTVPVGKTETRDTTSTPLFILYLSCKSTSSLNENITSTHFMCPLSVLTIHTARDSCEIVPHLLNKYTHHINSKGRRQSHSRATNTLQTHKKLSLNLQA